MKTKHIFLTIGILAAFALTSCEETIVYRTQRADRVNDTWQHCTLEFLKFNTQTLFNINNLMFGDSVQRLTSAHILMNEYTVTGHEGGVYELAKYNNNCLIFTNNKNLTEAGTQWSIAFNVEVAPKASVQQKMYHEPPVEAEEPTFFEFLAKTPYIITCETADCWTMKNAPDATTEMLDIFSVDWRYERRKHEIIEGAVTYDYTLSGSGRFSFKSDAMLDYTMNNLVLEEYYREKRFSNGNTKIDVTDRKSGETYDFTVNYLTPTEYEITYFGITEKYLRY